VLDDLQDVALSVHHNSSSATTARRRSPWPFPQPEAGVAIGQQHPPRQRRQRSPREVAGSVTSETTAGRETGSDPVGGALTKPDDAHLGKATTTVARPDPGRLKRVVFSSVSLRSIAVASILVRRSRENPPMVSSLPSVPDGTKQCLESSGPSRGRAVNSRGLRRHLPRALPPEATTARDEVANHLSSEASPTARGRAPLDGDSSGQEAVA